MLRDLLKRPKQIASAATLAAIALPLVLFAPGAPSSEEVPPVALNSFQTHSRLSFQVDEGVEVELKGDSAGFKLFFKGMDLADWGVPIGKEREWARKLAAGVADERLSGITLSEDREGVTVSGQWKFPEGDLAPAYPEMEQFDFRQKSPPRFVFDFWPKKGPTVADVRVQKLRAQEARMRRLKEEKERKRQNRLIARAKRRQEIADLKSYCAQKLGDSNDVFLKFRPVHAEFDFAKWFSLTTPDANYPYLEPKGENEEEGFVRLALKLYREGKPALAVRTVEFLNKGYPDSKFASEMRFLRANALLRLGLEKEAHRIFEELTAAPETTPVSLHAGMYIAGTAFRNKEHLRALERFLWLIRHYPDHRLSWVFHMGAAESLYSIRQTERASREYEWVVRNAPNLRQKAEAVFRAGDLYMERNQYEQALAAYYRGIRYFESSLNDFPSVKINRAESLYWIGKYEEAEKAFQAFLAEHPGHPDGWRATLRLAEIEGRLRGDASATKYREHLMTTINSYPYSAGALIARLRVLPCGDHGGFDSVAVDRFFSRDVKNFTGGGSIGMDGFAELAALSHVRTLTGMGRFEDAVEVNAGYLASGLAPAARKQLAVMYNKSFRQVVLGLLQEGKSYEALAFYEKYEKSMKDKEALVMPDFILKLAQAAGNLRLGELGLKLMARYREFVKEENRLPAADLQDRLKRSEEDFTEAKALWVAHGADRADAIRKLLSGVSDEAAYSGEKFVILGLIAASKGDLATALKHAMRAEVLLSNRSADVRLRIRAWIAGLKRETGSLEAAAAVFRAIEGELASAGASGKRAPAAKGEGAEAPDSAGIHDELPPGVPSVPDAGVALLAQAEIHEKSGKWGEAASAYARAVESGAADDRMLFSYARALGRTGRKDDRAKADRMLRKILEGEGDGFWKKLARDALDSRR